MDKYVIFLTALFVSSPSDSVLQQQFKNAIDSNHILDYFHAFGENLDKISTNKSLHVLKWLAFNEFEFKNIFNKANISVDCTDALQNLTKPAWRYIVDKNWKDLFIWFMSSPLFSYIDSWGFPSGRLRLGNAAWLGAYDECQTISGAHYCVAEMVLFNKSTLLHGSLGTCAPQQCSAGDIFHLLLLIKDYSFSLIDFPLTGEFVNKYKVQPVVCKDKLTHWPTGTVICVVLLCILALLNIIGTLLDIVKDAFTPDYLLNEISYESIGKNYNRFGEQNLELQRGNHFTEILICFSVLKNIPRTLSVQKPKNAVHSINGIRVISISWIILGHCYYFLQDVNEDNLGGFLINSLHTFSFQAISNAYVSVDTFFLLSGLLVAYLSLKKMDASNGKLDLLTFYFHRLIRLTPTYMFVIFIHSTLLPILINGPVTFKFQEQVSLCQKYWWTNLLYINNFYPSSMSQEMCLIWSWYLSNDMQFYVISPIFLYIMYRFKHRGALISTGLGILSCMAITISLTAYYNIPQLPSEVFTQQISEKKAIMFADYVYSKPYTRIAPYLVGLLLGNILSRDMKVFKRNRVGAIITWIISIGVGLAVVYGPFSVFKNESFFSETENILYGSLSRFSWAVAVSWVIYACHNDLGGLINSFLSWSIFIPFSRLTFGTYLVHPLVLHFFYYSLDNPIHVENVTMAFIFIGTWAISYGIAFVIAVVLDLPILNMEQILKRNLKKR